MKKILLVDDELKMLTLLSHYIESEQYSCIKLQSGLEAINYLQTQHIDLVILDVMMPTLDGWETSKKIREFSSVPIIFLTARTEKEDIIKGLRSGGDDYITKPFDEDELLARIEALLRRSENTYHKDVLYFKGLKLDINSFEAYYHDKPIILTPKEIALLQLFLQKTGRVFSREHLLVNIWGYSALTEDRTIDSHIRNLRDKLRQVDFPVDIHLQTVWGAGYKWIK